MTQGAGWHGPHDVLHCIDLADEAGPTPSTVVFDSKNWFAPATHSEGLCWVSETTMDRQGNDEQQFLVCLDGTRRRARWRLPVSGPTFIPTPAATLGSSLYFLDGGDCVAIDAVSASVTWRVSISQTFGTDPQGFHDLTVADGQLFIGDAQGLVICLDIATGRVQWSHRTPARTRILAVSQGSVLVVCEETIVLELERASGRIRFETESELPSAVALDGGFIALVGEYTIVELTDEGDKTELGPAPEFSQLSGSGRLIVAAPEDASMAVIID